MWMTKTHFSTFNRLNFFFQIIHSIIPCYTVVDFDAARDLCLLFQGLLRLNILHIKACVENKAQLCASFACISGYVLSDKEQNWNINKQLCWINLATVVAGLMKSKLTESQHIDICNYKPINVLNKKWGDKNPPQASQLWLKPHKKKQSL